MLAKLAFLQTPRCHQQRRRLDLVPSFISAENTTVDQAFFDALAVDKDLGATRGIDAALKAFALDALILPTNIASTPPAIAGYPIVIGARPRITLPI